MIHWINAREDLPLEKAVVMVYDAWANEFREDCLVLRDGPTLTWEWARRKNDVTHWIPRPEVPKFERKKRES